MSVKRSEQIGAPRHGTDLSRWFARVVIISLSRRPERLRSAMEQLTRCGWPFCRPRVFAAVDGNLVPAPDGWDAGDGAWGCMQSHRQVLEQAIMHGVSSILVMEDDVVIRPGFVPAVSDFLRNVPRDWDQLMIGGQLFADSRVEHVAPGVLKVTQCERTHCYALRGRAIRDLYRYWHAQSNGHCDWHMGDWQEQGYSVYAPERFLVGQAAGKSDISGLENTCSFWNPPEGNRPVERRGILEKSVPVTQEQVANPRSQFSARI